MLKIKGLWMKIGLLLNLEQRGNFSYQYFHTIRHKSHYLLIAKLLH